MTNRERIDAKLKEGDLFAAAELAIEYANGCGSKNGAWDYANMAISAVPDLRGPSGKDQYANWPATDAMALALAEIARAATEPAPQETPKLYQLTDGEDVHELAVMTLTELEAAQALARETTDGLAWWEESTLTAEDNDYFAAVYTSPY